MFRRLVFGSILLVALFGIFMIHGADNCTFDADCNHGRCVDFFSKDFPTGTKICDCNKGYVDFNGGVCNYKQKKQVTAFLFAFFLGEFGANWFYVGDSDPEYDGIGALKCLLFVIAIIFACVGGCCGAGDRGGCAGCMVALSVLTWLAIIAWYLADWIRIAADPCNMKDPNGICLEGW